jgi:hypothetical protein
VEVVFFAVLLAARAREAAGATLAQKAKKYH